jgi:molybdopterin-binding protein
VLALETDANNLLTNVKTAVSGAVATDVTTAQNYLNAVETVVSLFMAEFGSLTVGAAAGAAPKMSEADALAVLTKK